MHAHARINNVYILKNVNSKVLLNEYNTNLGDGTTLYYGTKNESECDTISITVKARFKPIIDKKDYQKEIKACKIKFMKLGNKLLKNVQWINDYYILTSDFTERGIIFNKPCKLKYQIYVTTIEKNTLNYFVEYITKLCNEMNVLLCDCLDEFGFEINK